MFENFRSNRYYKLGGPPTSPYDFVKQENKTVETSMEEVSDVGMAYDSTMNIDKLKRH